MVKVLPIPDPFSSHLGADKDSVDHLVQIENLDSEEVFSRLKEVLDLSSEDYSGYTGGAPKFRNRGMDDRRARQKAIAKRRKRNKNKKTHRR